jgi:hypothetical protein
MGDIGIWMAGPIVLRNHARESSIAAMIKRARKATKRAARKQRKKARRVN